MGDWIPFYGPTKSLLQLVYGDTKGAKQTFSNHFRQCPVLSQAVSLVQLAQGDVHGALDTQVECIKTVSNVVNGIPVAGHVKGAVHYLAEDKEGGDAAMKAASHSTAVVGAGIFGMILAGPLGACVGGIAGGAVIDVTISVIDSKVHKEKRLHGIVENIDKIVSGEMTSGDSIDMVSGLILDGLTGIASGKAYAKYKQTRRSARKGVKRNTKVSDNGYKQKNKGSDGYNARQENFKRKQNSYKQKNKGTDGHNAKKGNFKRKDNLYRQKNKGTDGYHVRRENIKTKNNTTTVNTGSVISENIKTKNNTTTVNTASVISENIKTKNNPITVNTASVISGAVTVAHCHVHETKKDVIDMMNSDQIRKTTKDMDGSSEKKQTKIPVQAPWKVKVNKIDELEPGMHIKWDRRAGYSHHAIVTKVNTNRMEVIHFTSQDSLNESNLDGKAFLKREWLDFISDNLFRLEYSERLSAEKAIRNAESALKLSENKMFPKYHLGKNNCEHLITCFVTENHHSFQADAAKDFMYVLMACGLCPKSGSEERTGSKTDSKKRGTENVNQQC